MARTPTPRLDYSNKDYEAFRTMMLDELTVKMPEYTDKRQSDAGVVLIELLAQGLDIMSFYQDVIANEVFLVTEEQRNNVMKWCRLLGYTPQYATSARVKQVFQLTKVQGIPVKIPSGTIVKTSNSSAEPEVKFETVKDLIIPAGKLGNETDENGEYIYSVDAVQGTTVNNEYLGISNGSASQKFSLGYSPVVIDSISIVINNEGDVSSWNRVENFVESSSQDNHFIVNEDDSYNITIQFGDGIFGKIPTTNAEIYCTYRVGGGESGNVGAMKINKLDTNIALVDKTYNPDLPYEYGHDRETLDSIKVNAPLVYRTRWGALDLEDFEEVIKMNFPEVMYAHASRCTVNPEITDIDVLNDTVDSLDIWIYLKDGIPLTEDYKENILSIFNENEGGRKIVGSKYIYLHEASVQSLDVSFILYTKTGYDPHKVYDDVVEYIKNYISPENIEMGEPLMLSKLVSNISGNSEGGIEGVKGIQFKNPIDEITYFDENTVMTVNTVVGEVVEV